MKHNPDQFSQKYVGTLEKHLKHGPRANLLAAQNLGREAVALRVETLELARIHDQALVSLGLSNVKNAFTKLAAIFFIEANMAIEATHRAARQTEAGLSHVMASLTQRTEQLAASNRQLQKGVRRRKVLEEKFAKRGKHHRKCLGESLDLQRRLRQLTHQVLTAQEDERTKISRELQDEIAQTLLGINVRLLTLKQEARGNTNGLKNHIASIQRLVLNSTQSVRRFARKLGVQPQTPEAMKKLVDRSNHHPDENKK